MKTKNASVTGYCIYNQLQMYIKLLLEMHSFKLFWQPFNVSLHVWIKTLVSFPFFYFDGNLSTSDIVTLTYHFQYSSRLNCLQSHGLCMFLMDLSELLFSLENDLNSNDPYITTFSLILRLKRSSVMYLCYCPSRERVFLWLCLGGAWYSFLSNILQHLNTHT